MDFMNLAEVPEVDSVQDGDTLFVVRDGEVCRVAKDQVGGSGAGGYLVEVGDDEVLLDEAGDGSVTVIIKTPVPGILEAAAKGAVVTIAADVGVLMGGEPLGAPAYITTFGLVDCGALEEDGAGIFFSGCQLAESVYASIYFANGSNLFDEASVATMSLDGETETASSVTGLLSKLRAKLRGGKDVVE